MAAALANERPTGTYASAASASNEGIAPGADDASDGSASTQWSADEGGLLLVGASSQSIGSEGLRCLPALRERLPHYHAVLVHPSLAR